MRGESNISSDTINKSKRYTDKKKNLDSRFLTFVVKNLFLSQLIRKATVSNSTFPLLFFINEDAFCNMQKKKKNKEIMETCVLSLNVKPNAISRRSFE